MKHILLASLLIYSGASLGVTGNQAGQLADYVLGPGDVLTVSVWKNDDLTRTVTVRPDGKISYPLVGDIDAAGLTPVAFKQRFTNEMKEFVQVEAREVSVIVDEVHSHTVSVLGEVRAPGRFEFRSQVSVLDALAMAGGLTEFASGSRILILRTQDGTRRRIPFNYNQVASNNEDPIALLPGDVVFVP